MTKTMKRPDYKIHMALAGQVGGVDMPACIQPAGYLVNHDWEAVTCRTCLSMRRRSLVTIDKTLVQVEHAKTLALEKHKGYKDLAGQPYVEHLSRVVNRVSLWQKSAAWLHDILEDTPMTRSGLLRKGVSRIVVDLVQILTHWPDENYGEYIQRLVDIGDQNAIAIKRADLLDHLRPDSEYGLPVWTVRRYEEALLRLRLE